MSPPRVTAQAAVLLVRDLRQSLAFWQDVLGFGEPSLWGEPPGFAILRRDGAYVMLGQAREGFAIHGLAQGRPALCDAYFWVNDARTFYEDMKRRGAVMEYDLELQPYGVLEFGVRDPEGRVYSFGQVM